jgi:hypothetical protein
MWLMQIRQYSYYTRTMIILHLQLGDAKIELGLYLIAVYVLGPVLAVVHTCAHCYLITGLAWGCLFIPIK